ncbi:MAG: phospho-N-acetylmuramoyl-pentapeptide-transferase [Chloroflexi bacterium]|nr:phospho-N-acetylmuramoyl-pentapeptide-transferase [Chloroflexota bacterium]
MATSLALGAITFMITVFTGAPLIRLLKQRGIGEQIRIEGPVAHQLKTGTPTMGGVMILVPVIVITLIIFALSRPPFAGLPGIGPIGESILLPLVTLLAAGILGVIDDWREVRRQRNQTEAESRAETLGILGRYKFVWLTLIAVLSAVGLYFFLGLRSMAIPSIPEKIDIGLFYLPVATFIILGSSNAVNLTDGLDGLAGGAAAIAFVAYGIIAFLQGQVFLVLFCFIVVGAILGFLWYNAYPAQLFMGDTGALPLGAVLGTVALMTGQWLLLPIVGLVFVIETLSVIIQVGYFRLSKGKRVFKMSPLHHHFELLGWSEVQVVQRFWLVSMLSAMLGVALALL